MKGSYIGTKKFRPGERLNDAIRERMGCEFNNADNQKPKLLSIRARIFRCSCDSNCNISGGRIFLTLACQPQYSSLQ